MHATPLDPARLDRFSVPSLAFMQARKDGRDLASRRWAVVEARLRAEGADDRAVLGIPDPVEPYTPAIPQATALGMIVGSFNRALRAFARDFAAGVRITDPESNR